MGRQGILFILSAPSGAGKTTIRKELLRSMPELCFSVSHTTRPARAGEVDGVDYFFVAPRSFQKMAEAEEFLEWAEVHGNRYGTARRQIAQVVDAGTDLLLDIDVQGAEQIVSNYHWGPVATIFVLPPDPGTLRARLAGRASETQGDLEKRLQNAPKEMLRYLEYDYVVVNDDLERAVWQTGCIIQAERCKASRFHLADCWYGLLEL